MLNYTLIGRLLFKKLGGGQSAYLTWQELNDYSDFLADEIYSRLQTKTPVVVYGHKNPYMLVCFLACVKAGRAYCPIDTNVPLSRVEAIIEEVEPELILTTEEIELETRNYKILNLREITTIVGTHHNRINSEYYVKAEDVYYIIFTSGSTGKPKGVQITRDCLDKFIQWGITLGDGLEDGREQVFINQAPYSFDLSVMDLYLSLYIGGTLWTLPKSVQSDMKMLYESLGESDADVWVSTPSFADVCLMDPKFSETLMPNLRKFLFCGEILNNKTVERLHKRFPAAEVVNTYGPTESTVAVTGMTITPEINREIVPLPVGSPKKGTWIQILNENGDELPEGKKGEIVIVGDTVSIGYWENETLSSKVFGTKSIENNIYRYYRTGDEGYLKEGILYYCGRIDLQIKLHGYRIELEDIENNLMNLKGVKQAAVLPKYRDGKVSSLVAFVVNTELTENTFEAAQKMRKELGEQLPEYMIPKKIKFMDTLPRTNNGKIDRKALGGMS